MNDPLKQPPLHDPLVDNQRPLSPDPFHGPIYADPVANILNELERSVEDPLGTENPLTTPIETLCEPPLSGMLDAVEASIEGTEQNPQLHPEEEEFHEDLDRSRTYPQDMPSSKPPPNPNTDYGTEYSDCPYPVPGLPQRRIGGGRGIKNQSSPFAGKALWYPIKKELLDQSDCEGCDYHQTPIDESEARCTYYMEDNKEQ